MRDLHIGPILRSLVRKKARSILTLSMTVLTFSVVVNCLMVIRAQQEELTRESGFDDAHLVQAWITNFDPAVKERAAVLDRVKRDLEVLRNTPGVVDVMSTAFKPWQGGGSSATATRLDRPDMEPVRTQVYSAGPTLANTLGSKGFSGKPVSVAEMDSERPGLNADQPAGVVISRRFADELFPGEDPLGRLVLLGDMFHVRIDGLIEEFYNPYAWNIEEKVMFYPGYAANADRSRILIRVDDQRLAELATLEEVLLEDSPQRGVRISTIPETRRALQATERMTAKVLSVVIVLMVFITAVSIIGLTAASVASRRREVGTRRALGATRFAILRHFLLENAALTAVGLALGFVFALGLNIALVSALDVPRLSVPWIVVPALLVSVANLGAAWYPAWTASRVPPALATKAQ